MKSKAFKILFFLFFSIVAFAQNNIKGIVTDSQGRALADVEIYNKTNSSFFKTNTKGQFVITGVDSGTNELVFFAPDFVIEERTIDFKTYKSDLIIILKELETSLSEVVVYKQKEKLFALNKLKDIEETAIYAGKKTEVIAIENLTANKATNNARQIFGQVAGLTINENSDAGLQLSIGGRGLNPNRTSNFNTRQNGYDISADVLGYPESYYATPTEALEEIQIVRGAASLQYGTQFGGLINFKIKSPSTKPFEVVTRSTVGSYNLFTNFTSLSGTNGNFSHYSFYNYKKGDGFRPNSEFDSKTFFTNLNYKFTKNTSLHFDYTHFGYLAKQPGGLTDYMFLQDPTQSNRERNWFKINWNLFALRFKHHFEHDADFSLQLFGLDAYRYALGYRSNRVSNPDTPGTARDLIKGDFVNWGAEARYLKKYNLFGKKSAFLIGGKYYQAENTGLQGPGSSGSDANFDLATGEFPFYGNQSDYKYPNLNFALFAENIFQLTNNFSVTPGIRFENIQTKAEGYYRNINLGLNGDVLLDETFDENVTKNRQFVLVGLGLSYKFDNGMELYGNISQNYRSVTFSDIRTANPSAAIDENITDEFGFTSDIGIRGKIRDIVSLDASAYALYYNDKIGEYLIQKPNTAQLVRYRSNVGTGITYGVESIFDVNFAKIFFRANENIIWKAFANIAVTESEYLKSDQPNIKGNKVEFVPLYNTKYGTQVGYKNTMLSLQYMAVAKQFTNAENSPIDINDNTYGIYGEIPAYDVFDLSFSQKIGKHLKLEAGINNVFDNSYFTRRATGYPGPGIIPSEPRVYYATLEFKF